MTLPSRLIKQALFGKAKTPDISMQGNLLNLLPNATLIVQRKTDEIIFANSEFLKLSAFSQLELQGRPIDQVLHQLELEKDLCIEEKECKLIRRQRSMLDIFAWEYSLDSEKEISVIVVIPQQEYTQEKIQWQSKLFLTLKELTQIENCEDLESALNSALKTIGGFFETDLVSIYQAGSDTPELIKVATLEEVTVFPESLPSTDLINGDQTILWIPGHRVALEIQKVSRILNLSYIATTPIRAKNAVIGLLIVGSRDKTPAKNLNYFLEISAAQIQNALDYYILIDNLRSDIRKKERDQLIFSSLFENTNDGVIILDSELRILKLNPAAEILFGYSTSEVVNKDVENLLIGSNLVLSSCDAAKDGISFNNLGVVHLNKRGGHSFPASLMIYPVNTDNLVDKILLFVEDVSENEEIRSKTQQLEHRAYLGEFSAIFAHEVRNPINNIYSGLQVLELQSENTSSSDLVKRMQHDCERLTSLVDSVLAYSKPFDPKFEIIDITDLLGKIMDRWRPRMARVNIEPYYQLPNPFPQIKGDQKLLEQVFTNLISNAVEAMTPQQGGTIAVQLEIDENIPNHEQIEIKISDSGPGIPDEIRGRIFEPFLTTKSTGTGLGLAICKRIITAHRGNISVNSFPGGTVFHVYLPVYQGEE